MRTWMMFGLIACGGGGEETATPPGRLGLCLDGPGVDQQENRATWAFSGAVEAVGGALGRRSLELDSCTWIGDGGRSFTLTDDEGETWTFGWSATAGSGDEEQPMTPALDLQPGDRIEVELRAWYDWANEHDVVIRDDQGVVFAAAEGWYTEVWAEVEAGSGLRVEDAGAVRSLGDDGCGARSTHALRFEADDSLELDVWVQGTLTWDGQALQARNVGAWSFDGDVGCTDVWGPAPWMVFREGP